MKVIYAGYSKCGTKTMNSALKELGYNVYDFMENYQYLGEDWNKIFTTGGTTDDFRRMFADVDAVTDIPGCFFWEEIHRAFPDAKIIWSERESEDVWWKSFEKQMQQSDLLIIKLITYLSPSMMKMDKFASKICQIAFGFEFKKYLFHKYSFNEMMARKSYRMHNSYVKSNAPKDKLHVIDFKEGWGPLCKFLGVPAPNKPFPHRNKGGSITREVLETDPLVIRMQREMKLSAATIVLVAGFCGYKLATRSNGFSFSDSVANFVNNFQ